MKDKKKIILSIFCVLSVLLITVGITYSLFTYTKKGDTDNTITTGTLAFLYTENTGTGTGISITNAFPVSDELGKSYSSDNQVFDFKVESEIVGDASIPYEVTVGKTSASTMNEKNIKLYLTDITEPDEVVLLDATNYNLLPESATEETEKQIYFDEVEPGEDYLKKFRLRMWIAEDSIQDEINEKTFTVKVNVYSNEEVVKKELGCNPIPVQKGLLTYKDSDCSKSINIGDEVTMGTESFYIIDNSNNNISMLAKYNLSVGEYMPESEKATGLQDYRMCITDDSLGFGRTQYSDVDTSYENSVVKTYVDNYTNTLNSTYNLSAQGSVISEQNLVNLNNYYSDNKISYIAYGDSNGKPDFSKATWVVDRNYWTSINTGGKGKTNTVVLVVGSQYADFSGGIYGGQQYSEIDSNGGFCVRPVITISGDLLK